MATLTTGVLPDDRYPDTEAGWRRRILDGDPISRRRPERQGLDPNEILDMPAVAAELTRLRRPTGPPYKVETVRYYRQNGSLPVPPHQFGGRDPEPGETIPVNGQTQNTAGHKIQKFRMPRPGEKVNCRSVAWPRWMIWQWESKRRGPGVAFVPGKTSGPGRGPRKEAASTTA
jgi:hypothetical protein